MNATQVDTHFWYEENRDGIVARHNGRWVVLSDCAVAGDIATEMDALRYAMGKFGKGRFLI